MSASPSNVHESWSSRFAFLMASIGAAVGLGNLWKFPYTLGESGGSAFVLIYFVAIFVIATPIMIAEMAIGRRGGMSPPETLRKLASADGASPRWEWLGWLGMGGLFLVLSFFSVIAGWSFSYLIKVASGQLVGLSSAETGALFGEFLHQPVQMTLWHGVFMFATVWIVARGIKGGIEKAVTYLMPALFVMLLVLVAYGAVSGDFSRTLSYLFTPDFSRITPGIALAAIGQAFFSVNVGVGAHLTYAAYLPKDVDITRSAIVIAIGDSAVALLAGLAIFPIVFAHGLDPAEGPGLIFVTLSTAFAQMPGGTIVGSLFFALLLVAALTSSISMLEVMTSRAEEKKGLSRRRAAPLIGAAAFVVGISTVLSFSSWENFYPLASIPALAEKTIFGLIDYSVSNVIMPIGGMLYALLAGWWLSRESFLQELGVTNQFAFEVWRFLLRFVAPIGIALVFVTNLA